MISDHLLGVHLCRITIYVVLLMLGRLLGLTLNIIMKTTAQTKGHSPPLPEIQTDY